MNGPGEPLDAGPDESRPAGTATRRRRHTARYVSLGALVVVAALVAALATRPSAASQASPALVGKRAPAIPPPGGNGQPVPTYTAAGTSFSLSSLEGRWIVVNFFASWCEPCQTEEGQLVAFARQHRGAFAPTLVGVVYDDTPDAAAQFLRSSGATWPAVVDPGRRIEINYGVSAPPETFLISPEGIVVAHWDGPIQASWIDSAIAVGQESGQ